VVVGDASEAAGGPRLEGFPQLSALPRAFYRRDPREVAPELLNKVLVRGDGRVGRIVETEAYCGGLDPASHSYRGPTARNTTMFGPAGRLYVYFTYGMHWCCNPVCGDDGEGVAVLLRSLHPVAGLDAMRAARRKAGGAGAAGVEWPAELEGPGLAPHLVANGPAKLCRAMGLERPHDGADLVTGDRGVWIATDATPPPMRPGVGPRVGISAAMDQPWRWWVPDHPAVSRRRR